MILLVAVIRPEQFDAVQEALRNCGIDQFTVTKVSGNGHEKGQSLIYRSTTVEETVCPRFKLEIAIPKDLVDSAICAIQQTAKTGCVGDGIIWLLPLSQIVRIRTGVHTDFDLEGEPLAATEVSPRSDGEIRKSAPESQERASCARMRTLSRASR
jgi:nitrogen regulatory protein PII